MLEPATSEKTQGNAGAVDFNLLMSREDGFVEPVNFGENVLHV